MAVFGNSQWKIGRIRDRERRIVRRALFDERRIDAFDVGREWGIIAVRVPRIASSIEHVANEKKIDHTPIGSRSGFHGRRTERRPIGNFPGWDAHVASETRSEFVRVGFRAWPMEPNRDVREIEYTGEIRWNRRILRQRQDATIRKNAVQVRFVVDRKRANPYVFRGRSEQYLPPSSQDVVCRL